MRRERFENPSRDTDTSLRVVNLEYEYFHCQFMHVESVRGGYRRGGTQRSSPLVSWAPSLRHLIQARCKVHLRLTRPRHAARNARKMPNL
jgi:hypothetical protein